LLKNFFNACHSERREESRSENTSNAIPLGGIVGRRPSALLRAMSLSNGGDLLGMTRLGGGEFFSKLLKGRPANRFLILH